MGPGISYGQAELARAAVFIHFACLVLSYDILTQYGRRTLMGTCYRLVDFAAATHYEYFSRRYEMFSFAHFYHSVVVDDVRRFIEYFRTVMPRL